MHPNEKRRRNTFGFNVLTIFKTIPLMVGYGKQEIIHFRSMHEAFDKSMYDVLFGNSLTKHYRTSDVTYAYLAAE